MRKLAMLFALAGVALPAVAARRVTVAQLEQVITANSTGTDAEAAQQLSELELTERLSTPTMARLTTGLPGEKSREELTILADRSAFLELPTAEIPTKPLPDQAAQRQMMALVVNYVTKSVHQLPNFLATRETHSFADRPDGVHSYLPLYPVNESSASVVYQDGKEVDTAAKKGRKTVSAVQGLTSWGEFGPILSTVLLDAAQNTLAWSHWEQGTSGTAGVFRYAVPAKRSHYRVQFCCVADDSFTWEGNPVDTHLYNEPAGYHGEMAVDPVTGTILRITVIADLAPGEPILAASIMVEYGAREIGGKSYVMPVRSVAVAQRHEIKEARKGGLVSAGAMYNAPVVTQLNDVAFDQYHLFRADARVLTPTEASGADESESAAQPESAMAAAVPPAASESAPERRDATAPANAIPVAAPGVEAEAVPPASAAVNSDAPARQTPVFKTTTQEAVVDVVVTKSNGDPVSGLGKQDFIVMENGKPQTVDFFEEHTANMTPVKTQPVMPSMPDGAVTNVPPAPESDSVNVLLIDTLNTEQQDRVYVQKQVTAFLTKVRPGTRMAIFLLGTRLRFVQGFTSGPAALLASVNDKQNGMKAQRNGLSRSDAMNDEADIATLHAMQASGYGIDALKTAQGAAQARDYAARASMTFEALNAIAHYLAGVKGRKNLIWFAGSFPVVIFPSIEQRASVEKNQLLPSYLSHMKQTADLFTDSQISIYPISAQGMMTEHVAEADMAGPGAVQGNGHFGNTPDGALTNGTMSPFVAGATERADAMHAMEQLAESTGGKAFYNTNDLNAAIEHAIDDGANYYTIGYSPSDKNMDGSFRHIDVKVDQGKYRLAYRHGYNADGTRATDEKSGANPLVPLLGLGMPAASGVLYGARAAAETPQPGAVSNQMGQNTALKGPLTRYDVDFVIRAQDLAVEQDEHGERSGRILIGLKGYDRDGNAVNWEGDQETLDLKPEQLDTVLKTGFDAHLEIDLPQGVEVRLVTAVYDLNSGKAGTLEVPLRDVLRSAASKAK